jgi:hypothetical protein
MVCGWRSLRRRQSLRTASDKAKPHKRLGLYNRSIVMVWQVRYSRQFWFLRYDRRKSLKYCPAEDRSKQADALFRGKLSR